MRLIPKKSDPAEKARIERYYRMTYRSKTTDFRNPDNYGRRAMREPRYDEELNFEHYTV